MGKCHLTGQTDLQTLLDFGPQPICNRFLKSPDEPEALFPLGLSQSLSTGLVEITEFASADELAPPYEWIFYTEAEAHLDEAVDEILDASKLTEGKVLGISYKDASLVDRLKKKGFTGRTLNPMNDLAITNMTAGIETIQSWITPEVAEEILENEDPADIVIARHIFEHAHDIHAFVQALKRLVKPGGYIVLEVPDFTVALDTYDYSTVWEEHVYYFTPITFKWACEFLGLKVRREMFYPYPLENSLLAVTQPDHSPAYHAPAEEDLDREIKRAQAYANTFDSRKTQVTEFLADYKEKQGRIAMFGAGHIACKFINLLGLKDQIDFVVDDHPDKIGMYMPGSKLPIVGSDVLTDDGVELCLLSLNPESAAKVIAKNEAFIERGGTFASIFPASSRSLDRLASRMGTSLS